jgi:hypothetical protein
MIDLACRRNPPRVYLAACEEFDLAPGDCMMVAHSNELSNAAKSGLRAPAKLHARKILAGLLMPRQRGA